MDTQTIVSIINLVVIAGLFGFSVLLYIGWAGYADKRFKEERKARIKSLLERGWSQDMVVAVMAKEVKVGMTEDMVIEAWGKPYNIDQKVETAKYYQERWTYGTPRRGSGASYITFRNGKVTKTQVNHRLRVKTKADKGGIMIVCLLLFLGSCWFFSICSAAITG